MNFAELMKDKPYIENKYHKTSEPFDAFRRMEYHGWECDASTGLDDAALRAELDRLAESNSGKPHAVRKAEAFARVLDSARIDVNEHDWFPVFYNWGRVLNASTISKWHAEAMDEVSDATKDFMRSSHESGDTAIWIDYDHSVPDWHALYELGFPGILARAREYRAKLASPTDEQNAYFDAIEIEYGAILRLIDRYIALAETKTHAKAARFAECMRGLRSGAPRDTYELLQLIYMYFILSECVDSYQVRSLGSGFDEDLERFRARDIDSGAYTADGLAELVGYFMMQFSAIGNYWGHPLYLGGRVSESSYMVLEVYRALGIFNPKLQIKYSSGLPDDFIALVLDMIRSDNASIVLVGTKGAEETFRARGIPERDRADFDIKGCYELACRAKEVSTGPVYVNLLGGVAAAMKRFAAPGSEPESYAEFERAYFDAETELFDRCVSAGNELERRLDVINPAPMFSATITSSLERGVDAYSRGSVYNTTVLVVGALGSAVDALMGVKYIVFDRRIATFSELAAALADNWAGHEALRAAALGNPHKYGVEDAESDACAARIAEFVRLRQGAPNARGGYYKVTIHSARQYIELGRLTPATPDGRRKGDDTSKNASPTMGMDRRGATALIRSALATVPCGFTEGHCLDVMLHPSALAGERGLAAMRALTDVYMDGGGLAMQFNVVDPAELRAAQETPEKYRALQIRVCGWNAIFVDMPRREQDEFMRRAEEIQ